VTYAGAKIIHF